MTLYFETEMQGMSFLALCAVGFGIALAFDLVSSLMPECMKAGSDILLFLLGGLAFLLTLFVMREGNLRLFHWLALLTGAILYNLGLRRCLVYLFKKRPFRKKTMAEEEK